MSPASSSPARPADGRSDRSGGRPGDRARGALALRRAWARLEVRAALLYLGLRLVSGVLLAQAAQEQVWFAGVTGPSPADVDLALSWDAQWYQQIATAGYPDELPVGPDGRVLQNPWAFYPLFPLTARLVSGLTGLGFATTGPLVALLAGLGAAVLMSRLLADTLRVRSQGPVLAAVAVWAAAPASPVLQMAYSESVAMLLLVANLWLLVRGRWWGAAACALLLGVARPIALPLAVVVVVALWMRWRERGSVAPQATRSRHARPSRPIGSRERVAMVGTLVATLASGAVWAGVAAVGAGRLDAYPATMTAWRGAGGVDVLEPWVRTVRLAVETGDRAFVVPAAAMVLALLLSLALLVPRVAPGIDLRLRVWAAAYAVYLLAVVDGHTSVVRYLVPLFPLAVVLVGAHRARRRRQEASGPEDDAAWVSRWWPVRTAFWVAVGVVGQVGWIWWLVLFEPPADLPP